MSSIASLAASLTSAIETEAKELEEAREELQKERSQLAEEKRRISNMAAVGTDLVKVNVGGTVFQTHRATLLSAEGSLLEVIFSGRWEESLVRDETGNVFFDFDPAPFRALLNYLRTRNLAQPGQAVPLPQVPKEHEAQFETMISFMGLKELIHGKEAMSLSQTGSRDRSIAVAGGCIQRTAWRAGTPRSVVGGAPLLRAGAQQSIAWKVSVRRLDHWVLVGVTTNPAPPDQSWSDALTYAWASNSQVWSGGEGLPNAWGGWPGWRRGDVCIFQLDAAQRVLRMHLRRTGAVYTLPLPADVVHSARLHFSLNDDGDMVEVSQVTEQELTDVGFAV